MLALKSVWALSTAALRAAFSVSRFGPTFVADVRAASSLERAASRAVLKVARTTAGLVPAAQLDLAEANAEVTDVL